MDSRQEHREIVRHWRGKGYTKGQASRFATAELHERGIAPLAPPTMPKGFKPCGLYLNDNGDALWLGVKHLSTCILVEHKTGKVLHSDALAPICYRADKLGFYSAS
jgi:hypothetical protein